MRDYRAVLIIFLILIGIIALVIFGNFLSLRKKNNMLSTSLEEMMKRIAILESDKTMEQITALRAENATLKKQIERLKTELSRVSKRISQTPSQEIKKSTKEEEAIVGNKGFLIKDKKQAP